MNKLYFKLGWMRFFFSLCLLFTMQFAYPQNIKEEPFVYSQALLDAAENGDADAMYKIGICYYVGKGGAPTMVKGEFPFERDYDKAFKYLSKAADKGSALAMVNLGNIYERSRCA
ncbi:tetratricopeptide repeat protein [Bacteroides caccae]|uniref:tetratricopeptide repeat protein n=1 Tax=Bacteroides caccae TaxID=47678 RepID=UPI00321AF75D